MTSLDHTYDTSSRMLHAQLDNVMGTRLDFVTIGATESASLDAFEECVNMVVDLDRRLSRFRPDSEISAINRSEPLSAVPVSDELRSILLLAGDMCHKTYGSFDVTLGSGSRFDFIGNSLIIPSGGLKVDLGGMAKGIAVDRIRMCLRRHNISAAFVSFGGSSIMGLGHHPGGDCWRVGVIDPFSGRQLRALSLHDSSLSTSGNSRGYRGHIIDPATGHAVTGRRLSAVVAPSATDAEVLSTAWLVADEECRSQILHNFDIKEEFVFN